MNPEMLKARTKRFAIESAILCEGLPSRLSVIAYSRQLIRSSSSVEANYRAACRAKSLSDFINKLKIVEEETDESLYFYGINRRIKSISQKSSCPAYQGRK